MTVRDFCSFCSKALAPGAKLCDACGSVIFRNTSGLMASATPVARSFSTSTFHRTPGDAPFSPVREAANQLAAIEQSNALKPEPKPLSGTAKLRKHFITAISNKAFQKALLVFALFSIVFIIIILALVSFQGGVDEWLPKTPHRHG
jgi:hypothetical protein